MTSTVEAKRGAKSRIKVAGYLTQQIELSGKTQSQIATEAGFNKPNIITMFKTGQTKLPLAKVGPMAKALGVDPVHLFKLVMQEYEPDTWEHIEFAILGQPILTQAEREILEVIRESNVTDPKIRTNEDRLRILDAVSSLQPA